MLKRGRAWFSHLSTAGKIGAVVAGVFCLLVVTSAIASPQSASVCKASTTTETETQSIPFDKTTVNDPNVEKDKISIKIKGVNGEKQITTKVTTYTPVNCKPSLTSVSKEETTKEPVTEVTSVGTKEPVAAPAPAVTPPPAASTQQSSCSPYYSPCVPNVSYDLDCSDIGMRVSVHGGDPYRLDADHDGIGCESY
jgi:resuscitation-promoting factor RpfB